MWGIDLPLRCCEADGRGFPSSGLAALPAQQERFPCPRGRGVAAWLVSLALITGSVLLKVSQLSGSCLAPRGLAQGLCPWRGAGAVQGSALPWLLVALCSLAFLTLFLLPQDYICPRCESGFIEELPEEPR